MTRPDNQAQKASPAYRLPALDEEFLLGDSMRGVRFMLEYAKAEEHLRHWGVRSTLVVFGTARARDDGSGPTGQRGAHWYQEARAFGRIASLRGGALHHNGGLRDNVIATGGGPGVMEAANRGALDAGAPTIGFNITLPHEQDPNPFTTPDLTFQFHYFAMRKMHLAMRANALIVFPGGFGTFDELFEMLTLRQTMKIPHRLPIVLYDSAFWHDVIGFKKLAEAGLIAPDDLHLFAFADDAEAIWDALIKQGLSLPVAETSLQDRVDHLDREEATPSALESGHK